MRGLPEASGAEALPNALPSLSKKKIGSKVEGSIYENDDKSSVRYERNCLCIRKKIVEEYKEHAELNLDGLGKFSLIFAFGAM